MGSVLSRQISHNTFLNVAKTFHKINPVPSISTPITLNDKLSIYDSYSTEYPHLFHLYTPPKNIKPQSPFRNSFQLYISEIMLALSLSRNFNTPQSPMYFLYTSQFTDKLQNLLSSPNFLDILNKELSKYNIIFKPNSIYSMYDIIDSLESLDDFEFVSASDWKISTI